jgi:AAHS family 4-hydroxybenzoate transporter-like MFS transporter
MPRQVNVADVIDDAPISGSQVRLFALCALCLLMDGFDVQVMGFVAPALTEAWTIPSTALTPVFSAGNLGILVGALIFTMVADKLGRRPVIIGATLYFSVMMLITAQATSVEQLVVLRFITGLGLGSIIPNATALIGEFSPRRKRVTLMMAVSVSFTAGAGFGGFISLALIPRFGWESVFYFGGLVPLVIAAAMYFWLPESLQFMVGRGRSPEKVREVVSQIDPRAGGPDVSYVASEEQKGGVPAIHLFADGRTPVTLLLWVVNFMNTLIVYSLSNWVPTVVRNAGYSATEGVLVGTILQVGGTLGTLAFAGIIPRIGFVPVLAASFAVGSLVIAGVGWSIPVLGALLVTVFFAGWCSIGAQPGLNAMSATFYPTYLRSTGIGWALGFARFGGVVGPLVGGELLRRQWAPDQLFLAAAVPPVIALIGILALSRYFGRSAVAATSPVKAV